MTPTSWRSRKFDRRQGMGRVWRIFQSPGQLAFGVKVRLITKGRLSNLFQPAYNTHSSNYFGAVQGINPSRGRPQFLCDKGH